MKVRTVFALSLLACGSPIVGSPPADRTAPEGPSLLSLLPVTERQPSGRFEMRSHGDDWPSVSGDWWTLPDGAVYMDVDLDESLVRKEIDRLLAMPAREKLDGPPEAWGMIVDHGLADHQLQLATADVLTVALGGDLAFDEQTMNALVSSRLSRKCAEVVLAGHRAFQAWARSLRPSFAPADGAERWTVESAGTPLASEATQKRFRSACTMDEAPSTGPADLAVLFERNTDGTRLSVSLKRVHQTDPLFEIRTTGQTTRALPESRLPSPLLHPHNLFRARIQECGELPWHYNEFAAAHCWRVPEEGYLGPNLLQGNRFACRARVESRIEAGLDQPEIEQIAKDIVEQGREAALRSPVAPGLPDMAAMWDAVEAPARESCARTCLNYPAGPMSLIWTASLTRPVSPQVLGRPVALPARRARAARGLVAERLYYPVPPPVRQQFLAVEEELRSGGFSGKYDGTPTLEDSSLYTALVRSYHDSVEAGRFELTLGAYVRWRSEGSPEIELSMSLRSPCSTGKGPLPSSPAPD